MKIQNRESDLIGPRRSLLKADPVAASAEQVSGRDQVAVARRLELQPRAVPDESLQCSESLKIKSFWTFYLNFLVILGHTTR